MTQVRALGPEDDLAGMFLQVLPLLPGPTLSRSRVPQDSQQDGEGSEAGHLGQNPGCRPRG